MKLLPKPSGKLHLSKFGYKVYNKTSDRHKSLNKASKHEGVLDVLRHTNLLRNLSRWNDKAYDILSRDVSYLSRIYQKEIKKN